jgi:hypothetical protein
MMVEEAFLNNNNNNIFTQSLRRCYQAFVDCKIYRLTPEWDVLISDKILGYKCHCQFSCELENVTIHNKCELCIKFCNNKENINTFNNILYPDDTGLKDQVRSIEKTQSAFNVIKNEFFQKPSGNMIYKVEKGANLLPFDEETISIWYPGDM